MAHHAWTAALYARASGASPAPRMRTSTSSASSGAPTSPSAERSDVYVFTVGRWPSARRFSNWRQTSSGSGDSPRPLRLRRMVASFCVATCTGKQLLPRAHFLHEYVWLPPARDIVASIAIGPDDVARGDSRGVAGSSDGFADAASVPISASDVTESTRVDAPALASRPIARQHCVRRVATRASSVVSSQITLAARTDSVATDRDGRGGRSAPLARLPRRRRARWRRGT